MVSSENRPVASVTITKRPAIAQPLIPLYLLCLLHLLQTSYQIQVILKERGFHKGVPTRRRRLVRTISAAGNNIVIHPIDKIKERRSVACYF